MKSYLQTVFIIVVLSGFVFSQNLQNSDEKKHLSIQTFEKNIDKIYKDINRKTLNTDLLIDLPLDYKPSSPLPNL